MFRHGYADYAVDAFRDPCGRVCPRQFPSRTLEREIAHAENAERAERSLCAQTFGDLRCTQATCLVHFRRSKSKELFASSSTGAGKVERRTQIARCGDNALRSPRIRRCCRPSLRT